MADEPNTTDSTLPPTGTAPAAAPTPAAAEPQAAPAGVKTFTQDEVNALIAREKRNERAKVERELKATTPTASQAHAAPPPPTDLLAEVTRLRQDMAFNQVMLDSKLSLSHEQRDMLRLRFNPDAPDEVIDLARRIYPQQTAPAAPTPQTPQQPPPAALIAPRQPQQVQADPNARYVDPGAANGDPDRGISSDPTKWSREVYERKRESDAGALRDELRAWSAGQGPGGARRPFTRTRIPRK